MPKIALPNKGRLSDDVRSLLRDAGLDVSLGDDRSLMVPMAEDFLAIFVRAQDIPGLVADGAADAGITGLDCIEESGRALELRADLGLGRCRLSLAVPLGRNITQASELPDNARVATSFPNLTRRYFEARGKPIEVVEVSGAAEVAPLLGVADAIVDLVATGSTLRSNGLSEVTTLLTSTAQLVSRPGSAIESAVERSIADLALALGSVVRARGKRYLMANVPRAALRGRGHASRAQWSHRCRRRRRSLRCRARSGGQERRLSDDGGAEDARMRRDPRHADRKVDVMSLRPRFIGRVATLDETARAKLMRRTGSGPDHNVAARVGSSVSGRKPPWSASYTTLQWASSGRPSSRSANPRKRG